MHDQEYMTIGLSQGKETLVDAEDFEELSKNLWYIGKNGYAIRNGIVNGKKGLLHMHRAIMNPPSDMEIDHINGNKLDNRKENLRICTRSENVRNQGMRKNNQSGYKGVSKRKKDKKWTAQIKFEGKKIYIGSYENKHDAARAYNEKAVELFQEFAWINQVRDGKGNFPIILVHERKLKFVNESKGRKTEEQREAKKKYDREYYQKRRETMTEEQHEAWKKHMRDYSKARRQRKKLQNKKDA